MDHYFQYLHIICKTFDYDCNGCKYQDKHKFNYCFLEHVLNNDCFIYGLEPWTIQDFNRIDKNKMAFLEGI